MAMVLRAMDVGETRGFMKAIVDADTDQILGAVVLGIEGGEIMSMLQLAMMGNRRSATSRGPQEGDGFRARREWSSLWELRVG